MGDIETNEGAASGSSSNVVDETESNEEDPVELRKKSSVENKERRMRNVESIMLQVERESDFKYVMDWPSWKPIFLAMYLSDVEMLSSLLRDPTTNVDVTDEKGNTALHCAVLSACLFGDIDGDLYNCIDLLMSQHIKLNTPNKKGYTAIGLAVHHLNKMCVEHMLEHPSSDRLYLDYYPGDSEQTVREIIIQTYPDLQPLLPAPVAEHLNSSDSDKKLLAALQSDKYKVFRKYLKRTKPNPWYDEPYHSSLLEIACQMKNRKQFVELLLKNGAHPNIWNRITGMPLLHATARSGNFELLETFLEVNMTDTSVKDNEDRTILHWLAGVSERKPGDKQRVENCFKLLLSSDYNLKVGIDDRDSSGNTALYIAVECRFQERATLLLINGADVKVFEDGSKILLSASLKMLKDILDDRLKTNDKPRTNKNYQLTFQYDFLNNIVLRIAESQHLKGLLRHPVVSTFLSLKWQKIKFIFFIDMVFYVMYVLSLSAYILHTETEGADKNTTGSPCCNCSDQTYDIGRQILWYCLTIFLCLLTTRELFQLFIYRWEYILSMEKWLELLQIVATVLSICVVVDIEDIRVHFCALAILLGWLELLLMSGRLPLLSVQLEMLKTVSVTFLRYMAGYFLLLVAFALSFYILLKNNEDEEKGKMLATPFISLLRTIVMFAGEFEASDLDFNTFQGTSHVVFVLFVFLVTIVLFNLLNGLAVSDTEEIRKNGETLSLVARVKLISKIETAVKALPSWMTPSVELTENVFTLYPNKPNSIASTEVRSLLRIVSKKRQKNKKQISIEHLEIWSLFTERLCELEKKFDSKFEENLQILEKKSDLKFEETHKILKQILSRQEILVSDKICAES